ncbi:hypothetical protein ACQPZX_38455 [Actinoplanes sp. CA-142083]
MLGSYNLVRTEKGAIGERAAADLNARWARWREDKALPHAK